MACAWSSRGGDQLDQLAPPRVLPRRLPTPPRPVARDDHQSALVGEVTLGRHRDPARRKAVPSSQQRGEIRRHDRPRKEALRTTPRRSIRPPSSLHRTAASACCATLGGALVDPDEEAGGSTRIGCRADQVIVLAR
jgi:hypothetical protein